MYLRIYMYMCIYTCMFMRMYLCLLLNMHGRIVSSLLIEHLYVSVDYRDFVDY